jgi:hypothetical protein
MADDKIDTVRGAESLVVEDAGPEKYLNADDLRLAQMGHRPELNRHFSVVSLIGLASTMTISWTGEGKPAWPQKTGASGTTQWTDT